MSLATPPTRRRSSTFSAIAAWAAHVQPGSPGSPAPTRRRPSSPDIPVDLTTLGYTSVFVHLLQSPGTPSHSMASKPVNPDSLPAPPTRTRQTRLKGFRSLSILRSRSNSTASSTLSPSPTNLESPKITAASIATRKKAVYAYAQSSKSKPKKTSSSSKLKNGLPPALAYELALMQFSDGGSTEENIKRLMESRARAAAPAGTKDMVVDDVYRDDKGGVWLDREQEMEYVHLLGGHDASRIVGPEKWVSFGGEVKAEDDDDDDDERGLAIASLAVDGRRGSAVSNVSLDLGNLIKPAEEDAKLVRVPLPPLNNPSPARAAQEPILTIPSRPRHARHHLRGSSSFFLLDLNAFSVPRTPRTPHTPSTPRTPRAPRAPASPAAARHTDEHPSPQSQSPMQRCRGAERRRPAPLNIVAHVPVRGLSPDHGNDENGDARKDFLDASFRPALKPESVQMEMGVPSSVPVKMHREAVYRGPSDFNGSRIWSKESWKAVKRKTSRPFLSLFGLK